MTHTLSAKLLLCFASILGVFLAAVPTSPVSHNSGNIRTSESTELHQQGLTDLAETPAPFLLKIEKNRTRFRFFSADQIVNQRVPQMARAGVWDNEPLCDRYGQAVTRPMSSYAVSADGPNYEAVNHNRLRVTRVGIQDNGPSCHQPLYVLNQGLGVYVLNQGLGVSDWLTGIQGLGGLGDRWQRMQDVLRQSNKPQQDKPQQDNSGQEGHLDVADPAMTTSEAILAIEFSPSAGFWPSENTASAGYSLGGGSRDISLPPLPDKVFALESTTNENNPLMTWQAADSEPEESNVEGRAVAQGNGFDSTLNGPDSFLLLEGITSPSLDQTSVEAPLINLFPTLLETQGKAENMDAFALRDLLAPTVEAPRLTLDWPAVPPQAVLYWSIDVALTEPLSASTPELDLVISPSAVFGSRIEEDLEPPPEIPEPGTTVALLLALGGLKVLKRKS